MGVLHENLLGQSQEAAPQYRYYQQCEDVATLAAVLFTSISKNHIFHNANKRTAFAAAIVFLRMNGYRFSPPLDEALEVARGVVENDYCRLEVAQWIADHTEASDSADLVSDRMSIILKVFGGKP